MGGMSAQIPIKGDEKANEVAMAKVKADKLREVKAGHDGEYLLGLLSSEQQAKLSYSRNMDRASPY